MYDAPTTSIPIDVMTDTKVLVLSLNTPDVIVTIPQKVINRPTIIKMTMIGFSDF